MSHYFPNFSDEIPKLANRLRPIACLVIQQYDVTNCTVSKVFNRYCICLQYGEYLCITCELSDKVTQVGAQPKLNFANMPEEHGRPRIRARGHFLLPGERKQEIIVRHDCSIFRRIVTLKDDKKGDRDQFRTKLS